MSLLDTASLIVTPNGYKEGKLYSVIPSDGSGDLSVTRATTATRVNSAGLVELVPYNLLSYSEAFDNAAWTKSSITISANSTTAPDGQTTADTLTNSSSSGIILQTYSSVNTSQIVTHSVYLKRTNNDWAVLAIARSGATTYGEMYVWFNLSTGVVGGNLPDGAAVILDTEIENVGNGWYRCSVTGYVPNAVAYTAFMLYPDGNNSFTRVTGQSVYAWGAQLVEGSTAKDYQKTETRLNIPRLDYSNGTCPSLLVEPQRTNGLTYSSSFDNSDWLKIGISATANATTSPSGIQDADKIIASAGTGTKVTYQGAGTGTVTASIYAKAAEFKGLLLTIGTMGAFFNLETGQYRTFYGSAPLAYSIESVGNGWYRCSITYTTTGDNLYVGPNDNVSNTLAVTGNGTDGIFVWGAQREAGSYSTSYIPTTSASVTRNADVISKTGISSLIGQTEGVIFADFYNYANNSTTTGCPISIANGGFYGNAVYIEQYLGNWYAVIWNGTTQQFISSPLSLSEGRHKLAVAYKANDIVFYADGVLVDSDTSASIPTCDGAYIGAVGTSTTPEQLAVNAVALWKTRLTNTQLAQLTTI